MANETAIPMLPCRSINETLEFYVAMGFQITYQQPRPNNYGCVKYEDINLHFFTLKGYEPKDSYSSCIVLVPDLAGLHQTFTSALRSHYGRLPTAGIPRISKLNNANWDKEPRFNVIDPGGNWIRFIQQGEQPALSDSEQQNEGETKLSRAIHAADWVVEAEGDAEKAAQLLDKALAHEEPVPAMHRVQALVLRAALAVAMDDPALARRLLEDVHQITLQDTERAALSAELQRADDLAKLLH